MSDKIFLYQINVTRDCDLRCSHCYIHTDKKLSSKNMTHDQFIRSISELVDFLNSPAAIKYAVAEVHVIGGEPSLLGEEFFRKAMPEAKLLLSKVKQKVNFSIVTNLLNPRSLSVAKLFDKVNTSYEVESRFISWKGEPKPKLEIQWLENVKYLKSLNYEINLGVTINKPLCDLGAVSFLDSFYKKGFKMFHFGFYIPSGDGRENQDKLMPEHSETSQFLIDATDWFLNKSKTDKDLCVSPTQSLIYSYRANKPIDDVVCPIIPGSIDVDWNGNIVTCIEEAGDLNSKPLGNIFNEKLSDILKDRSYVRARGKIIQPQPICSTCSEYLYCQGACYVLHQQWNKEGECPGYSRFLKYIRKIAT